MNILIVEDESSILEVESAYVRHAGYIPIEAHDGQEALDLFETNTIDLVILDINLPKVNGIEVCKTIRKKSSVPIIMVTARVEDVDEILGFELGVDDYIKKPFNPEVLVARIKRLMKNEHRSMLTHKDLTIDPEKMIVLVGGVEKKLTVTQFNILYTLAAQKGKVFTRDQILDKAYDDYLPPDIFERTIDAHIKSIRKVIEKDPAHPEYILTVIGRGYKFSE
jgi:DNA-binding response OmpR family regulator